MGGGGTKTVVQQPTQTTSQALLPPEVSKLLGITTPQIASALESTPLSTFTGANPLQVAGLTPFQRQALGIYGQLGQNMGLTAPEQAVGTYLGNLLNAPLGSDPATLAAVNAFDTLQRPIIENQMMLAGLGRSGALPQATSLGFAQAMVPLLQQGMALQAAGVAPALRLGETLASRPTQTAGTLFDVGSALQQQQQAQLTAEQQDFLRRQALVESLIGQTTGSILPSTIGQTGTSAAQRTTMPSAISGINLGPFGNFGVSGK